MNSPSRMRLSQASLFQARLSQTSLSQARLSFALLFVLTFFVPLASKASQMLVLAEHKRIEAAICPDSMNRIAIANDRITHIFGDEGTFESQNDENTGQVFLKPTAENGTKNLSLTLITEQGITQDLTLKPTAKSAVTLIFKNTNVPGADLSGANSSGTVWSRSFTSGLKTQPVSGFPSEARFQTLQDYLVVLLKQAVTGQLPLSGGDWQDTGFLDNGDISRASPEGFDLSHHQTYLAGSYGVFVFHVKNTTKTAIEMQEKSFYQPGDLAITLQKSKVDSQPKVGSQRILLPGSETLLYVVRLARVDTGSLHD